MDLFSHCLFYSAQLANIEKKHGSKPTDETVVWEVREIAHFFFHQMEPHLAPAYPAFPEVTQ